jgi:hypothetical protein
MLESRTEREVQQLSFSDLGACAQAEASGGNNP